MIGKSILHYPPVGGSDLTADKILEKLGEGGMFQNYARIADKRFVILIAPDGGFAFWRRIPISKAKSGGIV